MQLTRRGFVSGCSLTAMAALAAGPISSTRLIAEAAQAPNLLEMSGKAELVVLGENPLVAETPAHLLDEDVTSTEAFFIRNNGEPPRPIADPDAWMLTVDGEVHKPLALRLGEIKARFRKVDYVLQLECGGNGRSGFHPKARGNQWTVGGVGCARWGGVPLADVLNQAGLKPQASYTAHYGADLRTDGATGPVLSRGVRLAKAMEQHTLLAYEMNGKPIPSIHGGPLRLIVPGWPASASHKWLTRIWVRDREHDGPGMTGTSYRVPVVPGIPGDPDFDTKGMRILESMPVRSIITNLRDGQRFTAGTRELALRGHAWAGEDTVAAVHVSADFGQTWTQADVIPAVNRYAWQRWTATLKVPTHGYYELCARATDGSGKSQPPLAGFWNPQGYGGNGWHRVPVLIPA
ncbi:sulfite oxidase [Taklimakanibacter deserti]|uniref:sulfite oxidase n=1 Tax=Taklimakanibacter deserti TaxID=2267839 RepID=UPI0034D66F86